MKKSWIIFLILIQSCAWTEPKTQTIDFNIESNYYPFTIIDITKEDFLSIANDCNECKFYERKIDHE